MPHAYTEDQLFEQPAIGMFAEFGWTKVLAVDELTRDRSAMSPCFGGKWNREMLDQSLDPHLTDR